MRVIPRLLRAAAGVVLALISACSSSEGGRLELPAGVLSRLEFQHEGALVGFGPFVGYYFRPIAPPDITRLEFWCYNERKFYSSTSPENALLFTGEARLAVLPSAHGDLVLSSSERIVPVFFDQAPPPWLETRPDPKNEFIHFHSGYNRMGPLTVGYWLRHVGQKTFRYDMGGRVERESPLYHEVSPGLDAAFPRIVEFDHGPTKQP